ncbi:MAG: alanine racemase [Cyclobacteriaceae bacterium]|nr:alanine racemase [Cyclobacteriaceae bacterium]
MRISASLTEPTLLLDKQKCLSNISIMAEKALKNNVIFRPHFKTHQSHEVGRWFREFGVDKITVSSVKMAEYFASDGWKDITVAFPVNIHEKDRINRLAEKVTLNLLVVSPETVDQLVKEIHHPVNVFVEIDTGYHRTGVAPENAALLDAILNRIDAYPHVTFNGFLTHDGHSYKIRSDKRSILNIHQQTLSIAQSLKEKYSAKYPDVIFSLGDTPTCSVAETFGNVDEIRPGNFVFYDFTQVAIGSCSLEQIAVAMACPVVATYPERNEIVVHGGAVHFSKDSLSAPNGNSFGKVVRLTENGWSTEETGMYIKSLSQEHGIIHAEKNQDQNINVGDWLGVLPVHSCLTADVMKAYSTLEDETITMMR